MPLSENKTLVRRFVEEAQSQGNLAAIDVYMAPEFVDHSAFPGIAATREGVRSLFGAFHAAFPDFHVAIQEQIAENDLVVTRKTLTGTHQGDLMGIAPTNRPISLNVIDILRVVDGQITDHWTVFDQMTMLRQLGVVA